MSAHPLRWGPLVLVGLVAGIVNIVVGSVLYVSGVYFEPWALRLMTLLLAAYVLAGNWWYGRHVLAGHTSYPKALAAGIVISVVTGLAYITYNFISISFVYDHFLDDMIQAQFAQASTGMDTTQATRLLDSLRAETTLGRLLIGNFTAVVRLGTVFSVLISVAFLERWRRARPVATERV